MNTHLAWKTPPKTKVISTQTPLEEKTGINEAFSTDAKYNDWRREKPNSSYNRGKHPDNLNKGGTKKQQKTTHTKTKSIEIGKNNSNRYRRVPTNRLKLTPLWTSFQGVLEAPSLSSLPVTPRASSTVATTTTTVNIEIFLENGTTALEVPVFHHWQQQQRQ